MIDRIHWRLLLQLAASALAVALPLNAQTHAPAAAQVSTAPGTPEWKTYSYPADGFSASFPAEPQAQNRDIPTEAGSFKLRTYVIQTGQVVLFVGVCNYGAATAGRDPDEVLQGAKNGALTNSGSHLISEKKITVGLNHGIAFEAVSEAAHLSLRMVVVGTTLYQTLVISPIEQPYSDSSRFLDSFQLIANTADHP